VAVLERAFARVQSCDSGIFPIVLCE